jgi:uncharacterized protein (DUF849 family)
VTPLLKGCLNGRHDADAHPALPLTATALAADTAAAVSAGATAVHVHPRDSDGRETLDGDLVDATVATIRRANPGVPVGVSTGAWILPDPTVRAEAVATWREPDFAGVNLSEPGHRDVMAALTANGIAIEAGIWTVEDVDALARSGYADRVLRILVEPADADPVGAVATAAAIDDALDTVGIDAPRLHHGRGLATWAVLRRATELSHGIRVGLEDTFVLPDGRRAADNAALVAAARALRTAQSPSARRHKRAEWLARDRDHGRPLRR